VSLKKYYLGVGRRKTTVARVRVMEGKAMSTINEKPFDEYFGDKTIANNALKPISAAGLDGKIYFSAKVNGGGTTGQVEAIQNGLAKALVEMDPLLKPVMRKSRFITRDNRMVERKKYNQVKARKKHQFSKR
jgi:small subunit ribosomal protein S9